MKKYLFFALILTACSQKDEQFCKCMDASDKFNEVAHDLLEGKESSLTAEQRTQLKKDKESACANYQSMTGDEMLKRKADCE